MADGDWDWLDALINTGADTANDLGDLFWDTDLGDFVDPSQVDLTDVVDMSGSPSGIDPVDASISGDVPNVPGGPSGTSLSDQLRSRAADSMTDGTQPFDPSQMADPSASIASAGDGGAGWLKALGQGLGGLLGSSKALGGLGDSGTTGLVGSVGGVNAGSPGYSLPALTSSPGSFSPGGMTDGGSGGGLQGLARLATPEAISAALMHLQADPGPRLGLQAPIDAGPAPVRFTPLMPPPTAASGAAPISPAMQQRLSGLQRLAQERFG